MLTLTFCLGFSKQDDFVKVFFNLWIKLINDVKPNKRLKPYKPPFDLVQIPSVNPSAAWSGRTEKLPLKNAIGRICAELVYPCLL